MSRKLQPGDSVILHRPWDKEPRETTFVRWLKWEERTPHYNAVVDLYGQNVLVWSSHLKPALQATKG